MIPAERFEVIHPLKDPAAELIDAHGVVAGVLVAEVEHEGWHVNVYAEDVALHPALEPYVVAPGAPRRTFYGRGADTVALKFPDEATGREVLGIEASA